MKIYTTWQPNLNLSWIPCQRFRYKKKTVKWREILFNFNFERQPSILWVPGTFSPVLFLLQSCPLRVTKYLHSNSIGCVLCLLPIACWQNRTCSCVYLFWVFVVVVAAIALLPKNIFASNGVLTIGQWTLVTRQWAMLRCFGGGQVIQPKHTQCK